MFEPSIVITRHRKAKVVAIRLRRKRAEITIGGIDAAQLFEQIEDTQRFAIGKHARLNT
jgi:hypothetical protein